MKLIPFLILFCLQSCFVKNTIRRATNLAKTVTGKSTDTVYRLQPQVAYSVYANETTNWNAKKDSINNVITINNLIFVGIASRVYGVIKFNLQDLPQKFLQNPELIKEAILTINSIDAAESGLANLSTEVITKPFEKNSISWNNKPSTTIDLALKNDSENKLSTAINFRKRIIKMIKNNTNYGILLLPINDFDIKNSSLSEKIIAKNKNGVFAVIPINNINLMVY